jgi:hypothetical protein
MDLHSHLAALHHELEQYKGRVGEGFAERTAGVEAEIERIEGEIAAGESPAVPVEAPPAPPSEIVDETAPES